MPLPPPIPFSNYHRSPIPIMKTAPAAPPTRRSSRHADSLRQRAVVPIDPTARAVMQASRYSIPSLERLLDGISRRAQARNPQGMGASIVAWVAAAKEQINTGTWLKDRAAIQLSATRDKEPDAIALMAAAVEITTTNIVLANSNWLPFFEQRSLGEQDYPAILPEKGGMAMTVHTIGPDGGNRTIQSQLNSVDATFRKEVFDAIIQYFTTWGDGVMEGNPQPVEVLVASSHVNAFLASVGFATVQNMLSEQVFNGGHVVNYGGYNWIITGDNTIDPNQGMAYVRSNLPVGIAFDKPSLAKTIMDETPALVVQNKGRVCEIWCEAFALPLHWRKRTFGVCYKTPA